jgi:hypothetical protein
VESGLRERVARHDWKNVTLVCAPVESAALTGRADAALFHFTHVAKRAGTSAIS